MEDARDFGESRISYAKMYPYDDRDLIEIPRRDISAGESATTSEREREGKRRRRRRCASREIVHTKPDITELIRRHTRAF